MTPMSPLSRNPRDATIQSHDSRLWVRCQASLRGHPLVVTPTGLRSTGGLLSDGSWGLGHSSFPGLRGPLRGHHLVGSRCLEHRVEHAQQLARHRHDGPLLAAPLPQPGEEGGPFDVHRHQPPSGLHQRPPQQARALLGDVQILGPLAAALPYRGNQPSLMYTSHKSTKNKDFRQ